MADTSQQRPDKENLKSNILEASKLVLESQGRDQLSIRKVAKEVGCSPGTIYLHYKDKDALLLALHQDISSRKAALFAPLMLVENPQERILAMGRLYIQNAVENPADFNLMFLDKCPINALEMAGKDWNEGYAGFDMLKMTLQEGIDKGIFNSNLSISGTAMTLWATVHGYASLYICNRLSMLNEKEKSKVLDDMFQHLRGILLMK